MTNTQTSQGHITARTLRRIWDLLREREPRLPAVTVNVVPTIGRTRAWLRYTPSLGDTHVLQVRPDALAHRPREVVCQVAHEAAHALAHVLGVADTSKRGRYHNARFRTLAEHLGLEWRGGNPPHDVGYADMKLPAEIGEWEKCLEAATVGRGEWENAIPERNTKQERNTMPERSTGTERSPRSRNSRPKAVCGCLPERPLWLSRTLLNARTVACTQCGESYRPADEA